MLSAVAIAFFFLRFWRKTHDRLFGLFALAFLLLGIERVSILAVSSENRPGVYLLRLCAFLLIIFAIADKNRKPRKP